MKKVLIPLNLRSEFQNVLDYARSIAERSKAHLTILYVSGYWPHRDQDITISYDAIPEKLETIVHSPRLREAVNTVIQKMQDSGIEFDIKILRGGIERGITRECATGQYDMMVLGSLYSHTFWTYLQGEPAGRLIGEVSIPVIVVPSRQRFEEIGHITYAVDLEEYDPKIIQQIKSLAAIFDAKLTVVHVNKIHDAEGDNHYAQSLSQTISDTLDYPKIFYKFFDHTDPFAGIRKFINQNETSLVAMTNRKRTGWGGIFHKKSLTRKMVNKLTIPLLAFHKYSA
jgi:nucleotide-binding universal stress UspA family protein